MKRIILFDGVCNLCNSSVNLILDYDLEKKFQFASLQSNFAQSLILHSSDDLKLYENSEFISLNDSSRRQLNSFNSILYLEDNVIYQKSEAALRIASHLGWIFKILLVGKILPVSLRDFLYTWIARNRYKWFGKSESCRMPTPELKERFLG